MTTRNTALERLYFQLNDLQFDFRNKNLNNLILSKLNGNSVIDVGCGAGHFLMLAKNRGMDVYGIEPNLKLVKLAKNLYKNLNIKPVKAEESGILNRKFDNVILMDVIEHIKDDIGMLKSVRNLLEKNGRLIVVTSAYPFLYGIRDKKVGHFRRYSKKDLIEKLQNTGYKINEARYWDILGFFPYFFFEKILKKNLLADFRQNKKHSFHMKLINRMLDMWFRSIENRFNFGFGLSHIVIAGIN